MGTILICSSCGNSIKLKSGVEAPSRFRCVECRAFLPPIIAQDHAPTSSTTSTAPVPRSGSIAVVCPSCRRAGDVPVVFANKPIRCKGCGKRFAIAVGTGRVDYALDGLTRGRVRRFFIGSLIVLGFVGLGAATTVLLLHDRLRMHPVEVAKLQDKPVSESPKAEMVGKPTPAQPRVGGGEVDPAVIREPADPAPSPKADPAPSPKADPAPPPPSPDPRPQPKDSIPNEPKPQEQKTADVAPRADEKGAQQAGGKVGEDRGGADAHVEAAGPKNPEEKADAARVPDKGDARDVAKGEKVADQPKAAGGPVRDKLKQLLADLKNGTTPVKIAALEGIAALGPDAKSASEVIIRVATEDRSPKVRTAAIDAFEKVDSTLYAPTVTLLVDQDYRNRARAITQLQLLGGDARPVVPLLLRLERTSSQHNVQILRALYEIDPHEPGFIDLILNEVSFKSDPFDRHTYNPSRPEAIKILLGLIDDKIIDKSKAVKPLLSALQDGETIIQAINALGDLGGAAKEAVPVLTRLKLHEQKAVREAAKAALEEIGEK
jgi:hypothetical protein